MRSSFPTLRIFQSPFTKLVGWSTAKLPALRAILKWEIMHGLLNDTGRINTRTGFSKEKRSALRFLQQAPKRWATFFRCTRKEVTLFCREFHYWRIYAFFCANFRGTKMRLCYFLRFLHVCTWTLVWPSRNPCCVAFPQSCGWTSAGSPGSTPRPHLCNLLSWLREHAAPCSPPPWLIQSAPDWVATSTSTGWPSPTSHPKPPTTFPRGGSPSFLFSPTDFQERRTR